MLEIFQRKIIFSFCSVALSLEIYWFSLSLNFPSGESLIELRHSARSVPDASNGSRMLVPNSNV